MRRIQAKMWISPSLALYGITRGRQVPRGGSASVEQATISLEGRVLAFLPWRNGEPTGSLPISEQFAISSDRSCSPPTPGIAYGQAKQSSFTTVIHGLLRDHRAEFGSSSSGSTTGLGS